MKERIFVHHKNNKYWNALLFIGVIAFLFTIFFNRLSEQVSILFLLPFSYICFLYILKPFFFIERSLAFSIIGLIATLRYIGIPILFALDNQYTGMLIAGTNFDDAVLLMVYELLAVSIALRFFFTTYCNKQVITGDKTIKANKIHIIKIALILFWIFLLMKNPSLKNSLWNFSLLDEDLFISKSTESGVVTVFFYIGKLILFCTIITLSNKHIFNKYLKFILVILACTFYISSSWTAGENVSRWSLMIAVLISLNLLLYVYPKKKKLIYSFGIGTLVAVVLLGSVMKLMSFGRNDASISDAIDYYLNSEYFDEYFSGIGPVANGIRVCDLYDNYKKPEQFIVDCFNSFPYAMKIVRLENAPITTEYYHRATKQYDLIMPNVTISMFQFGWLLSFIYPVVLAILAMWFDRQMQLSFSITKKMFLLIPTFWCSLFMAVNVNIVNTSIWPAVIGILFLILEEKIIRIKK